jgi:hypothetical protein
MAAMRVGDRFRVGSITKSFVAAVVLQLAGEGRLGLDDPVERWLPGLVPDGRHITVRQLLNHTSGLFNCTDDPRVLAPYLQQHNPNFVWRPRQLVAIATSHPALFPPGTAWSYSNTEVRFEPLGDDRTLVRLEHRDLEAFGTDAAAMRATFEEPGAWTATLAAYAAAAGGPTS